MSSPPFDEPQGEARKSVESAQKPRLELVPWAAGTELRTSRNGAIAVQQ
jgi:hypothetical protein